MASSWLSLLGNVGPDIDPDQSRYQTLVGNIGVATSSDQARHQYLLALANDGRPCPFITALSATIVTAGSGLTITGWGLTGAASPAADPWGAEVRLYVTPDHDAAYDVLAITSRTTSGTTGDTLTVTIPDDADAGFVAVVHTSGAVCDGSNFIFVDVFPSDTGTDVGWWIEVWDLPGQNILIGHLNDVIRVAFQPVLNGIGSGLLTIPADHPRLRTIIDPDPRSNGGNKQPRQSSQIRVYIDGRHRYTFLAEDLAHDIDDASTARAVISGDGIEALTSTGVAVRPGTTPGSINPWPRDLLYGSTDNQVRNGDLEDPPAAISNPDFEDGTTASWEGINATVRIDEATIRSGTFALRIENIDAAGEGAKTPVTAEPGQRVYITGWIRTDPTGTVMAELVTIEPAEESTGTGTGTGDDVVETVVDDELVNAGATWTEFTLTGVIGSDVTSTELRVTRDATPGTIWLDDIDAHADPAPWFPNGGTGALRLDKSITHNGQYSLLVANPARAYSGAAIDVDVEPAETHRISIWIRGSNGDQLRVSTRFAGVMRRQVVTGDDTWQHAYHEGVTGPDQTTLRILVVNLDDNPTGFRIDDLLVYPGEAAATPGKIIRDILIPAQDRGAITGITHDFTGTLDSAGDTWDLAALQITIPRGQPLADVLGMLSSYGVDWRVRPNGRLQAFNRLGAPLPDLGETSPVITSNDGYITGRRTQHVPPHNTVLAEGADGLFTTASRPADIDALGRRETYLRASRALDAGVLSQAAGAELDQAAAASNGITVTLRARTRLRPFVDFNLGDTILVDLPGVSANAYPEGFRVVGISVVLDDEVPLYQVALNWLVLEDDAASAAAIRALIDATGTAGPGYRTSRDTPANRGGFG